MNILLCGFGCTGFALRLEQSSPALFLLGHDPAGCDRMPKLHVCTRERVDTGSGVQVIEQPTVVPLGAGAGAQLLSSSHELFHSFASCVIPRYLEGMDGDHHV